MTEVRRAGVAGAVLAAVVFLSACTLSSAPSADPGVASASESSGTTSAPSAAAASETVPAPTPAPLAAGTEVGSATFTARPDSEASGSFTIVAGTEAGQFDLVPQGFAGPADSQLTLLPYVIDDGQTCADTGFRFSFGSLETLGTAPLPIPSDLTQGDPSVFGSAVLTVYSDADREQNDCLATVVAAASIQWMPGLVPS